MEIIKSPLESRNLEYCSANELGRNTTLFSKSKNPFFTFPMRTNWVPSFNIESKSIDSISELYGWYFKNLSHNNPADNCIKFKN